MKETIFGLKRITIIFLISLFYSCQEELIEDEAINVDMESSVNALSVIDLTGLGDDSEFWEHDEEYTNVEYDGLGKRCITTETDKQTLIEKINLYGDQVSGAIFPGNMLQGNSFEESVLTPNEIPLPRSGRNISLNIFTVDQSNIYVDEITKGKVSAAINNMVSGDYNIPANFTFYKTDIESVDHLAMELGIRSKIYGFIKLNSTLSFNTNLEYNRHAIILKQIFYTATFDQPTQRVHLIPDDVKKEQVESYIQDDNRAAFISDVDYGRHIIVLIESIESETDIKAAIEAAFNSNTGSVDLSKLSHLDELTIQAHAYGGSSDIINGITDIEKFGDYLNKNVTIETGLPISYSVKSAYSGTLIRFNRSAIYQEDEICIPEDRLPPGNFRNIMNAFVNDGHGGGYGAIVQLGQDMKDWTIFFNREGDQYIVYNIVTGTIYKNEIYKLNEGPIGDVNGLEQVGAAWYDYEQPAGQPRKDYIYLLDKNAQQLRKLQRKGNSVDYELGQTITMSHYIERYGNSSRVIAEIGNGFESVHMYGDQWGDIVFNFGPVDDDRKKQFAFLHRVHDENTIKKWDEDFYTSRYESSLGAGTVWTGNNPKQVFIYSDEDIAYKGTRMSIDDDPFDNDKNAYQLQVEP